VPDRGHGPALHGRPRRPRPGSAYVSELTAGSHVIITVGAGDPAIGNQIIRAYDARAWQPGWTIPAPFWDRAGQGLAGVAVKP
jgi:hypothetical protein